MGTEDLSKSRKDEKMRLSLSERGTGNYLRQRERVNMKDNTSKFKADILKDMGRVVTSSDLEHRVLIVRDEEGRTKVSLQVWWREEDNTFHPGKGYFLNGRKAITLARLMKESLTREGVELTSTGTNTQKHVVINKNRIVSIDKWWRKGDSEDWTLGKSVAIDSSKAEELATLLHSAGIVIIHSK